MESSTSSYRRRAEFYDIEYIPLNDTNFLDSFISDKIKGILEVPCGSGFHLEWLMGTGKYIYVVDKEPEMIEAIKRKINVHKQGGEVQAICGLMESHSIPKKVDLIIFPQESFQFLNSDEQVIETLCNAYQNLNTNGIALIDTATFFRNTRPDIENIPRYWHSTREERLLYRDWLRDIDHEKKLLKGSSYVETSENITFRFCYKIFCLGNCVDEYSASISLRKYQPELLINLISKTGFTVENIFGNYTRKKYEFGDPRLIFVLRKYED